MVCLLREGLFGVQLSRKSFVFPGARESLDRTRVTRIPGRPGAIVEIGGLLLQAKAGLEHGEFLKMMEEELP